jgi:hypothetical protein
MMAGLRTIGRHVALAGLLGLLLVTGDILLRQTSQYRQAEQARKDGKFIPALTAYESAIRMYVPGSPLVERSARQIWALADEREAAGDIEGALLACRGLRSAFYGTHSLITPGAAWIARCDDRITALLSRQGSRH